MQACPQCGRPVDATLLAGADNTCRECGAKLLHADDRSWADVARVANLAEAGFLSDELIGLGIDARIHQMEEFSALTDRWSSRYLIRVPARVAREAAAHIRIHQAEESGDTDADSAAFRFTAQSSLDPLSWRPVALVILAGVSSFVLGQRWSQPDEAPPERRPNRQTLSSAVERIGRPLVTDSAEGQPRHRLSFDAPLGAWLLDTDHDGDGRYESRQSFHVSEAAR